MTEKPSTKGIETHNHNNPRWLLPIFLPDACTRDQNLVDCLSALRPLAGLLGNDHTPGCSRALAKFTDVDRVFHRHVHATRRERRGFRTPRSTLGNPEDQPGRVDVGICCARVRSSSKRMVLK